jgi:NADP-dependent 3-hydroxy acid dehydrogenase YdfG
MTEDIAGKVVIITGASSGLGEATARHLAAQGAHVTLGARRKDRLEALASEIRNGGGKAEVFVTDVSRREDVEALVKGTVGTFGRVDVLINNAGIMLLSLLDKRKVDEWDRMIDVNIKGVLYGIAAVLPVFQNQGSGHFINVSSVAGHKTSRSTAVYSATKFAVRALSEGLRQEVGPHIRTTIISPGAVATELPNNISDPDVIERIDNLYKIAIPADAVARAIAYAISEPADVDINEIVLRPTAQEL